MTTAAAIRPVENEDPRLELEQDVLAAFLSNALAALRATHAGRSLRPADFKCPGHPVVFAAILDCCNRGHQPMREALERLVSADAIALDALHSLPFDVPAERAASALHALLEHGDPALDRVGGTRLLSVADIFAPLPAVNWTLRDLDIAPGPPTLTAGFGFSGKTVCWQDVFLAAASDTLAWGRFPVRGGRALHLDYEQGSHLTAMRYQRLARARGIDPRDIQGRLTLANLPEWHLDTDAGADEAMRLADGFDIGLVDSFRAACPQTDENSSEARVPLDRLNRISEKTGITWVVIHHARKPSQNAQGGARMAIRGSGALYDACGSVLVFSGEKGEPITVEHEKAKITGRTHDSFRLQIEDVEVDGDLTAGLRVTYLDADPVRAKQTSSDRLGDLKHRILTLAREEKSIAGGVNAISLRLSARKDDVRAALAELEHERALLRGGTYHRPVLSLPGADRDAE
jgi:hypothetical protein